MRHVGAIVSTLSAVLAMIGTAVPAPAQTPVHDGVPLEFVEALSRGPFGPSGPLEVMVGGIPERTARAVPLPDDGRIVGSLVYRAFTFSAVAVPGAPAVVRDDWTERLLQSGWTRYKPPSRGGFASNPTEGLQFCMGDSATLNLSVSANPRGGSYVRVTHPTRGSYNICQQRERTDPYTRESLIPSLAPPAGAVALGSGTGGGGNEWEAHARIRTELSVDDLVVHYGSQLRDHGWQVETRTRGPGAAAEVFRVTDSEGAAWHGVLVASASAGESDRFLSLRLIRMERLD
jgi:hypothetical protein